MLVEHDRRHDQHAPIDHSGQRHGHTDIDQREAEQPPLLLVIAGQDAVLGQGAVQVDHVRHHGGAKDPGREQEGVGPHEGNDGVIACLAPIRAAHDQLGDIAAGDDEDQSW